MIVDDFFSQPMRIKRACDKIPLMDFPASDGVTYPGIISLPEHVRSEIDFNFKKLFGEAYKPRTVFGRYSFQETKQPHWAHSDGNMAQMLGLIYLSDANDEYSHVSGTLMLCHSSGFSKHPRTESEKQLLLRDSLEKIEWFETYYCPSKFNRLFVMSADFIHAAGKSYGSTQEDGRFVISVFFDLENVGKP